MERRKCFCNGSRGTDCDYCQGTGYIIEDLHLNTIKPKLSTEPKHHFSRLSKASVIPNFGSASKIFDERIFKLKAEIAGTKISNGKNISSLKEKINTLIIDSKKLQNIAAKKERHIYNKIRNEALNLQIAFNSKFTNV